MGMHWESNSPRGTSGVGVWGGQKSRLVGLFYEWRALAGSSTSHLDARTGVLQHAVSWLLGHSPPEVHIVAPAPGAVVTGDFLPIRYSIRPDAGRAITGRWVDYSLDGGDSWAPATTAVCADSGCIWDLAGALGGAPTPNSTDVRLRVRVADDGSPALQSTAVMSGSFALARTGGDTRGPVLVAGSATLQPAADPAPPAGDAHGHVHRRRDGRRRRRRGGVLDRRQLRRRRGAAPRCPVPSVAPPCRRRRHSRPTNVLTGSMTLWLRGRDAAGNWGAATALTVPTSGSPARSRWTTLTAVDFLAHPEPQSVPRPRDDPLRARAVRARCASSCSTWRVGAFRR